MKQTHSWILGAFENIAFIQFPKIIIPDLYSNAGSLLSSPLYRKTSLAYSLFWVEIMDSLCPFILEYFFLISQSKFQLGNYILPISNSSVISIGYGVFHTLALTPGVALGIVQKLLCSIPVPFQVS